ncbi:MAG: hypothetical protein EOP48_13875 [Sphingobacteriales bacterium]|nr:MAG: hypothetical protein EOP48_13875 [Sphingobacteriales bacterium]
MATNYKWTIRFSILTPVLVLICIILMGGGHGWYAPAVVIFPWATLNTAWQDHLSEPFMMAGAFQFIVYGVLFDKSSGRNNESLVTASILLSHIILAALILVLRNPEWR